MSRFPRFAIGALLAGSLSALAQDDAKTRAAADGDAPEAALKKMSVAPGLQAEVWAAEPLLENPIAFSFDHLGRAFVAVTHRRRTSTPDIRKHDDWRIENLALRTVEERIAFLKSKLPESPVVKPKKPEEDINKDGQLDWRDWAVESEEIRIVEDSTGAGRADKSRVFAGGFNNLETGLGAGVLAMPDGGAAYTCVPDLWRIAPDGTKTKLATGFGVHVAFGGHDMHGAKLGPDGRLYWTIADCGAHVTTKEGKGIDNPDSGAVFRCDPDGSNMELFATGLRNPQSLAWNDVGDLFTGDNNADGGDKARWTHVVEGADYGWRIGWQFLPKLGAWNSEGMWHLDVDKTNLALLPSVAHIGHGPAGIAYYPGTGLPEKYRDHFFMADFPGGVRAFKLKPKGASYALDLDEKTAQDNSAQQMTGKAFWGLYPSDVAFAPGGGLYVLDWVYGWEKTGKGRIFRLHDPAADADPLTLETKRLLGEGMEKRSVEELAKLLGHADHRVRLAAQFELVRRGDPTPLAQATLNTNPRLMRLHGIWGVTQLARTKPEAARTLMPLAMDRDAEVRAQWAKFVGETRVAEGDLLERLLADPEPRVRFFAAQALGKIGAKDAVPVLLTLLGGENGTGDAFIRHAAAVALAALAEAPTLAAAGGGPDAVRASVLLALRRQRSPEVARFLADKNPQLVLEAARAIHDAPIPAAYPQLVKLLDQPAMSVPLARRAVNAAYRLGTLAAADALGHLASRMESDEAARLDALDALAQWNVKLGRDRVLGIVVPLAPNRDADAARLACAGASHFILANGPDPIRAAMADTCAALNDTSAEVELGKLLGDAKASGAARAAALRALAAIKSPLLAHHLDTALADKDKILLETARKIFAQTSPEAAVKMNAAVLGKGSVREQQAALATIAAQPGAEADRVLAAQLDLLLAGKLPNALSLDVLEGAARRTDAAVKQKLATFNAARKQGDPLAAWRECLDGGDAKIGKDVFYEKAEAACMRCHKVKGEGGDVGPDMAGVGTRHDRAFILQSIVDPNAVIAPGYENVMVTLKDGNIVAGLMSAEDANSLTLKSLTDGKPQRVAKADVKERTGVPSAMPPGLAEILGKRDLRNVVEFLADLK